MASRLAKAAGLLLLAATAGWAQAPRLEAAQADALIAAQVAPVAEDDLLARLGGDIVTYGSHPETMTFRFRRVDDDRPLSIGLPDGSIYLSRGLLAAVAGDEEQISFFCASEAERVADGVALGNVVVAEQLAAVKPGEPLPSRLLGALDGCLTPERLFTADQAAMLALARAGIPPLEAVRALEAAARTGARFTHVTESPVDGGTLLDRKVAAAKAASDLIKGATDFDFAVLDLSEGNYRDAAARFEQFLKLFPRNYAGWNNVGLCYYHLAIERLGPRQFLLADAIAEWDTSFLTRSNRGIDRELWDKAKAAYDLAVSLDPSRVEAHSNLGNLLAVDDQADEAEASYQRALAIQPNHAITLCNLGAVQAETSAGEVPREALARFTSAAEADATLAEAQYNLGLALSELRIDGAEAAYRRYLALAPTGAKADVVRRELGERPSGGTRGPGRGPTTTQPTAADSETALSLWNRVQLALESRDRELVALLNETPDQQQPAPGRDVQMWGWSRQGLVVELVSGKVNRVMAGRPPGHEAQTQRGVEVGLTTGDVSGKYGAPPAVSHQNPYDVWLYPRVGVGFFVIGDKVNKIFLFPTVEG